VAVGGTIDRPSYTVDFGAATEYAVTKTITDKLTEALFGKEKAPADTATTGGKSAPVPTVPTDSGGVAKGKAPLPVGGDETPASPGTSGESGGAVASDVRIRVDSHRFRGNVLQPELAVRGVVSGSHLGSLVVVVTDDTKHEVHRETLLAKEIAAAYGTRPRSEAVTVPFDFRISGAHLPPLAKSVTVTLTALSDTGETAASVSFSEKNPLGVLF
jgi:hypothetical protein